MKRQEYWNAFIAAALSSLIALAGIGCLASGFSLDVADHVHILSLCIAFSLLCSLCFHIRWGNLIVTLLSILALLMALQWTDLLLSIEKALYSITYYYDKAYDCGYLRWSDDSLRFIATDGALTVIAFAVILSVSWTVCRRKWFGFGVIAGLLPLVLCCIVIDSVPEESFLWMLLTGLVLLTLTQRLRRIRTEDATRLTAFLLTPVVLFTSLVFRLSPEDGYEDRAEALQYRFYDLVAKLSELLPEGNLLFPGMTVPPSSFLQLQGQVDLGNTGPRKISKQTVMYINAPVSGSVYLRGQSFDSYTGTGWESTVDCDDEGGWPRKGLFSQGTLTVRTLGRSDLYYTPYYPGDPDWIGDLSTGYLPNPDQETTYTFDYHTFGRNTRILCTPLSDRERRIYRELPDDTRKRAEKILKDLFQAGNYTDERKAELIEDFVRRSADYDLQTGYMPDTETDFAMWFLEQEDNTGYCVHFASAAAVLLRAAGIPARYVTGYVAFSTAGQETAVTADLAHAWVEYFHPNKGWIVLDATPGVGDHVVLQPPTKPTQTTTPTESTRPTETTTPTETTQPTETTVPTETTTPTKPTAPTESTVPTTRPTESTLPSTAPTETVLPSDPTEPADPPTEPEPVPLNLKWIRGILQILLLWALLAAQYKLRILVRKKWLNRGTPNQKACKRWRYARFLSRITTESAQPLLPLAEKAAFSQHTMTDEELAAFDAWYRQASAALLAKPWLWQFFLRILFAIE